ncbi:MAG: hypothetical protein HYY11_09920 [Candidatus Methylomirabilis oxyfera]|nr:hypothetical protein [Candidatus Methylomirabilis oxyfera]
MAEELTRKRLKVFGVAVTDFEDQCQAIAEQARREVDRGGDPAAFLPMLEGLLRSSSEVFGRWLEVTRAIVEQQQQTNVQILGLLDGLKKQKGFSS